jgi:hypothetical protein
MATAQAAVLAAAAAVVTAAVAAVAPCVPTVLAAWPPRDRVPPRAVVVRRRARERSEGGDALMQLHRPGAARERGERSSRER